MLAIAIGMPIRSAAGELWGSLSILAISAVVPIIFGLLGNFQFDFERLRKIKDATISSEAQPLPAD